MFAYIKRMNALWHRPFLYGQGLHTMDWNEEAILDEVPHATPR